MPPARSSYKSFINIILVIEKIIKVISQKTWEVIDIINQHGQDNGKGLGQHANVCCAH
jgi:hypothetical protein